MGDWFVQAMIILPCTNPIASLAFLFEISRRISGCCISEAMTTTLGVSGVTNVNRVA